MSDPKNDQSQYRHPWRNEEEENVTVDTNVQKSMIINQIATILRKSKQKTRKPEKARKNNQWTEVRMKTSF